MAAKTGFSTRLMVFDSWLGCLQKFLFFKIFIYLNRTFYTSLHFNLQSHMWLLPHQPPDLASSEQLNQRGESLGTTAQPLRTPAPPLTPGASLRPQGRAKYLSFILIIHNLIKRGPEKPSQRAGGGPLAFYY